MRGLDRVLYYIVLAIAMIAVIQQDVALTIFACTGMLIVSRPR